MENSDWMVPLLKKVKSHRTSREISGVRQSRRIEGAYTHKRGQVGRKNAVIYIEKGLGNQAEEIAKIISRIIKKFAHFNRSKTRTYLFSFGWNDNKLHGPVRPLPAAKESAKWKKWIIDVTKFDPVQGNTVIPRLYFKAGAVSSPGVGKKDINIFICKNKQIYMSELAVKTFGNRKQKSGWIFLQGENKHPDWHFGKFIPEQYSPDRPSCKDSIEGDTNEKI